MAVGLAAFVAASHVEAAVAAAAAHSLVVGAIAGGVGLVAAAWALRVARRPARALLLAGAAGAATLAALWLWTRTLGVPLSGGARAPVGVLDAITAFDELLLAGYAIAAARSHGQAAARDRFPLTGCVAISLSFVALAVGCAPPSQAAAGSGDAQAPAFICHLY
jgi:hypothetical protein